MYNSITNKAVVNDFDFATLMNPGEVSPMQRGCERTGTMPFMAIELLKHPSGQIQRRYCHDLESFAWCLLWYAIEGGFPDDAVNGEIQMVCRAKLYLVWVLEDSDAKPRTDFTRMWQTLLQPARHFFLIFQIDLLTPSPDLYVDYLPTLRTNGALAVQCPTL